MNEFLFYYRGFGTQYRAVPTEQTYLVYAGDEPVVYFEPSEMQKMIDDGKILKVYPEGE